MKLVLQTILPQILPDHIRYTILPHEGKTDLRNSIKIKLRAWRVPNTRFVIVQDKDSNDCYQLKKQMMELANKAGRPNTLIRIACTELESWFLGDLDAVKKAYSLPQSIDQKKRKYRDPDKLANAKQELKKIASEYQQLSGSARIASYMTIDKNQSKSFNVFLAGVQKILAEETGASSN